MLPVRPQLQHVLEWHIDGARARRRNGLWESAAVRIANDEALRRKRDFRVEALRIVPIDTDQEIEKVGVAINRVRRQNE